MVQPSHPYTTTGKIIVLTIRSFLSKVMSLFFNTPGVTSGKESACQCRIHKRSGFDPESGRSPRLGHEIHSNILAWKIPWSEEPGRLWSVGLPRVWHDWSNAAHTNARFVIAFLPRSKSLLISWLQSSTTVILEPRKRKSSTVSTFSHLFAMK